MARVVIFNIVMFLLPFVLYGAYAYLTRTPETADGEAMLRDAPWGWLVLAGTVTVAVALAALISFSGAPPGGTYYPSQIENGVIKPGRIE